MGWERDALHLMRNHLASVGSVQPSRPESVSRSLVLLARARDCLLCRGQASVWSHPMSQGLDAQPGGTEPPALVCSIVHPSGSEWGWSALLHPKPAT